jgi:hypothetical protein
MLFMEIIAVDWENHNKHTNTLCGQNLDFLLLKKVVHTVNAVLLKQGCKNPVGHIFLCAILQVTNIRRPVLLMMKAFKDIGIQVQF